MVVYNDTFVDGKSSFLLLVAKKARRQPVLREFQEIENYTPFAVFSSQHRSHKKQISITWWQRWAASCYLLTTSFEVQMVIQEWWSTAVIQCLNDNMMPILCLSHFSPFHTFNSFLLQQTIIVTSSSRVPKTTNRTFSPILQRDKHDYSQRLCSVHCTFPSFCTLLQGSMRCKKYSITWQWGMQPQKKYSGMQFWWRRWVSKMLLQVTTLLLLLFSIMMRCCKRNPDLIDNFATCPGCILVLNYDRLRLL